MWCRGEGRDYRSRSWSASPAPGEILQRAMASVSTCQSRFSAAQTADAPALLMARLATAVAADGNGCQRMQLLGANIRWAHVQRFRRERCSICIRFDCLCADTLCRSRRYRGCNAMVRFGVYWVWLAAGVQWYCRRKGEGRMRCFVGLAGICFRQGLQIGTKTICRHDMWQALLPV